MNFSIHAEAEFDQVPRAMTGAQLCSSHRLNWKLYRALIDESIRKNLAYTAAAHKRGRAGFRVPRCHRPHIDDPKVQ